MKQTVKVEEVLDREQLEMIVNGLELLREEVAKTHDKARIPVLKELLAGQHDRIDNLVTFFTDLVGTWDRLYGGDKDG